MTHLYHCHTRSLSHTAHTFIAHTVHTYMYFLNTPTHTLAHSAAQHWVFLNTVLLGGLLYNMCLRDSQSYSDLFHVSVGRDWPHKQARLTIVLPERERDEDYMLKSLPSVICTKLYWQDTRTNIELATAVRKRWGGVMIWGTFDMKMWIFRCVNVLNFNIN